ncbi:MAG: hypothetical protein IPM79_06930 [Polyangiaceae bacterium]|jgi:hypothetical protein|nr:hypothetical protein [Polyangiaceae bacterium]MBK8937372.1 hypothetical protein [Polyangiaceae bacterium]
MKTSFLLTTLLSAAVTFVPALSYADDADKAACVDLDEGDDCTRGDGGPGVCIPDESDPDVLTCDDDPSEDGGGGGSSSDSGGAGCAIGSGPSGAPLLAVVGVALAAAGLGSRRRRHPRA